VCHEINSFLLFKRGKVIERVESKKPENTYLDFVKGLNINLFRSKLVKNSRKVEKYFHGDILDGKIMD